MGLRVLNTRPKDQAAELSQCIQQADGISIEYPLLVIEHLPPSWISHLPTLSTIQSAIFVSKNAVESFFHELQIADITWPQTIECFAIGQSTASALAKYHNGICQYPPISDSEHLLQLNDLQHVDAHSILLVSGEDSRPIIQNTLHSLGAKVTEVAVYRRTKPEMDLKKTHLLWQEDAIDTILIFSQQAMVHLFDLFEEEAHGWIQSKPCIVISPRLEKAAQLFGFQNIILSSYDNLIPTLASLTHALKP